MEQGCVVRSLGTRYFPERHQLDSTTELRIMRLKLAWNARNGAWNMRYLAVYVLILNPGDNQELIAGTVAVYAPSF